MIVSACRQRRERLDQYKALPTVGRHTWNVLRKHVTNMHTAVLWECSALPILLQKHFALCGTITGSKNGKALSSHKRQFWPWVRVLAGVESPRPPDCHSSLGRTDYWLLDFQPPTAYLGDEQMLRILGRGHSVPTVTELIFVRAQCFTNFATKAFCTLWNNNWIRSSYCSTKCKMFLYKLVKHWALTIQLLFRKLQNAFVAKLVKHCALTSLPRSKTFHPHHLQTHPSLMVLYGRCLGKRFYIIVNCTLIVQTP